MKPVIGPIPFASQVGASEEFVALMQGLKEGRMARKSRGEWALALPHAIVKVMKSRVYSIAVHPSTDKIVVAVGGKSGELAFWDATDVVDACHQNAPATDFENVNDLVPPNGKLPSYREFEPRIFAFQPHAGNDSGSVSNLCYKSTAKLLSTSYDGSIRCMDINKAVFDDVYRGDDLVNGLDGHRDVWWFSHGSGIVSRIDFRAASRPATFHLHNAKIGTVSVHDGMLCTASNDRSIAIWDIRALKPEDGRPLQTFACGRAVTSAYVHPASPSLVLSTCYDDLLRIHDLRAKDGHATRTIKHNNQTGRWITPFKAVWDPKSTLDASAFICSSMDRCIDIYGMDTKLAISHEQVRSPMLTSQPAVCCVHPGADIVCAGNASGKIVLYTRPSS